MDLLDTRLEAALKRIEPGSKAPEDNGEKKKMKIETRDYLEFVAFLMSQNLSYAQIERIGRYLQKKAKEKHLSFLKTANFDQKLLSKISQDCFGKVISDDLIEKLSSVPYFFIVDNSTFCGESLCAIKVRFLSKQWEEELE